MGNEDFRGYVLFLARLAASSIVAVLVTGPLFWAYSHELRAVGELLGAGRLAQLSRGEPILWLSGFYDSGALKTEVATRLRPRIAVFGSSRVMQIRREMFRPEPSFYNLGGDFRAMDDARINLEQMLDAGARPELIVLGLDWWWFQAGEGYGGARGSRLLPGRAQLWRRRADTEATLCLDQIQLVQKAWRDRRFREAAHQPAARDRDTGRLLCGVGARTGSGFRNDGSYRYVSLNEGERPEDKRREGLERFRAGMYKGNAVNSPSLQSLRDFISLCRGAGISLVIFLPPVEKEVLEAFRHSREAAGFWSAFPEAVASVCRERAVPFHDFSDPEALGVTHRQFVDWFHGSEAVYARILLRLAREFPETLGEYVAPDALAAELARAGSASSLYRG